MTEYWKIVPSLEHIYLEDSWVLKVMATPGSVEFLTEFVLTEEHPDYHPPRSGEHYCYETGLLTFSGWEDFSWTRGSDRPNADPDGTVDYGNYDVFEIEGRQYSIVGGFGKIRIVADPPRVLPPTPVNDAPESARRA